jgi:hypothetical protein
VPVCASSWRAPPARDFRGSTRSPTRWARQRLAAGATTAAVAAALGIGRDTLRRWIAPAATTALVPVEIVDAPHAAEVCVVSPSGFRISGLTIDDAIAVLRRLG